MSIQALPGQALPGLRPPLPRAEAQWRKAGCNCRQVLPELRRHSLPLAEPLRNEHSVYLRGELWREAGCNSRPQGIPTPSAAPSSPAVHCRVAPEVHE